MWNWEGGSPRWAMSANATAEGRPLCCKSYDAQKYFDALMASRKQTYQNNEQLPAKIKNEFVEKKEYFAFASESDYMTYNVYASIDGSTVIYAFVEGPNADVLKAEYYEFMKKMECSVIKL